MTGYKTTIHEPKLTIHKFAPAFDHRSSVFSVGLVDNQTIQNTMKKLLLLSLLVTLSIAGYAQRMKLSKAFIKAKTVNDLQTALRKPSQVYGLDLSQKKFKAFPTAIFKLKNLRYLKLGLNIHHIASGRPGYKIKKQITIPASIAQLKGLEELHIGGCGLTALPTEIGQLKYLKVLDVSANKLTSLPASVGQLKNLQEFHFAGNKLTTLPKEIGQLKKLESLYISFDFAHNPIKYLPKEIGQLTNLKSLTCCGTYITSLPSEIGNLQKLERLFIFGNKLKSLPATIGNLQNLKELSLGRWKYEGNQFKTLPASIGRLKKLKFLYLYDVKLESLPTAIGNLSSLEKIGLSKNPRLNLTDTFKKLSKLLKLDGLFLNDCQLRTLPDEIALLKQVSHLEISSNKFRAFPAVLTKMQSLVNLDLTENPLSRVEVAKYKKLLPKCNIGF